MTLDVPQRPDWIGPPVLLGEGWRLHKVIGGLRREAVCELWSHQLGWELRLVIDGGELTRSQVCRSNDEILDVQEQWKSAMVGKAGGETKLRVQGTKQLMKPCAFGELEPLPTPAAPTC